MVPFKCCFSGPIYMRMNPREANACHDGLPSLLAKQKYPGMFETQKFGNKTSSKGIGLNIRALASPKVGQDKMSGGVSLLCWHAATVVV